MAQQLGPPLRLALAFLIYPALFLLNLLLRLPTFARTQIDMDESVYLVMADQWSRGHPPYTVIWDHLCPGIHLIFRVALALFGRSVFSMRLAAVLAVFVGAVALLHIGNRVLRHRHAGVVAAIAYSVFSLGMNGLAANTELFHLALLLSGLSLLLRANAATAAGWQLGWTLGGGLLLGSAFQVKFQVLPELIFFSLFFLYLARGRRGEPGAAPLWLVTTVLGLGVALPTLWAAGYFWSKGLFSAYLEANFLSNARHLHSQHMGLDLGFFLTTLQVWLRWTGPLMLVIALAYGTRFGPRDPMEPPPPLGRVGVDSFLLAWLAVSLVGIAMTLKFWDHYYLMTLPSLCLLFVRALHGLGIDRLAWLRQGFIALFILVLPIGQTAGDYRRWHREQVQHGGRDAYAVLADAMRARMSPGDPVYLVNAWPVLYFLTEATIPTPLVFFPHLLDPHFNFVSGVDQAQELDRIFAQRPRLIVVTRWSEQDYQALPAIVARMRPDYDEVFAVGPYRLYQRREARSAGADAAP